VETCAPLQAAVLVLGLACQSAAQSIPDLDLHIDRTMRLLILAPHPDDEVIGAGGLIQRVVANQGAVHVVLLTSGDAFAEAVETVEGIKHPKASDYRHYGTMREHESLTALGGLGVAERQVTFLGFPDEGMCLLASRYLSAKRQFESPFTDRLSPPLTEQVIRGVRYRGTDVRRELAQVISDFAPTVIVMPHQDDDHPDHCATHIFGKEALAQITRQRHVLLRTRLLYYLVHNDQWPLSPEAVTGAALQKPADFPVTGGHWSSLRLTESEIEAKRQALLAYASQMRAIGRLLLAFGRSNELFVDTEPASKPECWCDARTVATESPTPRPRRHPQRRR
jgi:LmbE family N-acetylglucosaminyl deacetylase